MPVATGSCWPGHGRAGASLGAGLPARRPTPGHRARRPAPAGRGRTPGRAAGGGRARRWWRAARAGCSTSRCTRRSRTTASSISAMPARRRKEPRPTCCAPVSTATGWSDGRVILVGGAGGTSRHFGSRLAFDREGLLYVSLGERGEMAAGAGSRPTWSARSCGSPTRAPCRRTTRSSARAGARPEIYAYGVRNPQGLARQPAGPA